MNFDYSMLTNDEAKSVREMFAGSDDSYSLVGYIPDKALPFIARNYKELARLKILEKEWIPAYIFGTHFADIPIEVLLDIFDQCDRAILQEVALNHSIRLSSPRTTLFRGCAGPVHRKGMSWTSSLDKAIYYAAWHATRLGQKDDVLSITDADSVAVYATTVDPSEIYCLIERNEAEYIVHPANWWKVDVPLSEFNVARPRFPKAWV